MKLILSFALAAISLHTAAQTTPPSLLADTSRMSRFAKALQFDRYNLVLHAQAFGNVRNIAVWMGSITRQLDSQKIYAAYFNFERNDIFGGDIPVSMSEFIDADELPAFIGYLKKIKNEILLQNLDQLYFTEYRFYTRGGILLECYTGNNQWRTCLREIATTGDARPFSITRPDMSACLNSKTQLQELIEILENIHAEINRLQKAVVKQ